jgi:hypothetical protein
MMGFEVCHCHSVEGMSQIKLLVIFAHAVRRPATICITVSWQGRSGSI